MAPRSTIPIKAPKSAEPKRSTQTPMASALTLNRDMSRAFDGGLPFPSCGNRPSSGRPAPGRSFEAGTS
jgi:hypothetical protein